MPSLSPYSASPLPTGYIATLLSINIKLRRADTGWLDHSLRQRAGYRVRRWSAELIPFPVLL